MQTLVNCKLEVCKALGIPAEHFELSMGMSGDFEQAVRKYPAFMFVGLRNIK
jgi:uncharacterized pyridoxal phosphate-containing UPF0001 family protein